MSYNIMGLPSALLSSDYSDSRFALIGQLLSKREQRGNAPEIVAPQEAFSDPSRALIQASGYPNVAAGPDDGWHGIWSRAVDHHFYSADGPVTFKPVSVERSYRERVEGLRLSNHPAHEVSYELSWAKSRGVASERARP